MNLHLRGLVRAAQALQFRQMAPMMPFAVGLAGVLASLTAHDQVRHPHALTVTSCLSLTVAAVLGAVRHRLRPAFARVQIVPAVLIVGVMIWAAGPGPLQTAFAAYYLCVAAHLAWWRSGLPAAAALAAGAVGYALIMRVQGTPHWGLQAVMFSIALSLVGGAFASLAHRLGDAATRDALTGLWNRTAWQEQATAAARAGARRGESTTVAILDLDAFKQVNDRDGHNAGDRMLVAAATAWQAHLRPGDVLGRWGGDEFVVLVANCDLEEAARAMARLRAAAPDVPFSYGLAPAVGGDRIAVAVTEADGRLIEAKAARRRVPASA